MEIMNDGWAVGGGWPNIDYNREYDYHSGVVVTPHGIVTVYAQGSNKYVQVTRLGFAHAGRWYTRRLPKRYTPRGLVTKAKQYAREIAEGREP